MGQKVYYPYLDLLKFVCCVGVVAIHTQPAFFMPNFVKQSVEAELVMMVPVFFMISAFLLARNLHFTIDDLQVLKKFVLRLALLYGLWTILMAWEWIPGFVKQTGDDWALTLLLKLVLRGAPHGSWFIMSLLYGSVIVWNLNMWMGMRKATILFATVMAYITLVDNGVIPDIILIHSLDSVVEVSYSAFVALFPIQLGFLLHKSKRLASVSNFINGTTGGSAMKYYTLILVCLLLPIAFGQWRWLSVFYFIPELLLVMLCSRRYSADTVTTDFSMLRKMSVIVYFVHFAFASGFGFMYKHGWIDYQFGIREFAIAVAGSVFIAYVLVKLSARYPKLRYLY